MGNYNNGILDDIFYTKEEKAAAKAEAEKLKMLSEIANSPAKTNKLIYVIPAGIILVGGIIAIVLIRKKRK